MSDQYPTHDQPEAPEDAEDSITAVELVLPDGEDAQGELIGDSNADTGDDGEPSIMQTKC